MAGNLSDYLEVKLLDHFLGTTTYTKPATVYLALYTAAPTDSTAGTEVSGGSYARKVATFNGAASGSTTNTSDIDFNGMPACTVVAIAVTDALTSGNILDSELNYLQNILSIFETDKIEKLELIYKSFNEFKDSTKKTKSFTIKFKEKLSKLIITN